MPPACEQKTTSEKSKFGSNKKLGLEWTINGLKNYSAQKSDPTNQKKQ